MPINAATVNNTLKKKKNPNPTPHQTYITQFTYLQLKEINSHLINHKSTTFFCATTMYLHFQLKGKQLICTKHWETEQRNSSHYHKTDNHATYRQKHARKHQSINQTSTAEALQKETATVFWHRERGKVKQKEEKLLCSNLPYFKSRQMHTQPNLLLWSDF